ncbi:MAG: alpha/beta hydrolase [Holophagaceae bacterium]|nr:alpha/beta hydrolase [Holophagaceae bacterium]
MRLRGLAAAGATALLGTGAFIAWKSWAVARELVDPPFYRPQPLARVDGTYASLARGGDGDPGGAWHSEPVGDLQVWTLRRARPSRGIVLLLHGFGDDRWGTSPALKWFPDLDAAIFTYRRRDDAIRAGLTVPPVTFGALEHREVVAVVRHLEGLGWRRDRILLMGRSLGASVGLLAASRLEAEGGGPLGGLIWEGAPASSRDFAERLVRGPRDRAWHVLAPAIGGLASAWAGRKGAYDPEATDLQAQLRPSLQTPSLCFMATQDRLAPLPTQRLLAARFARIRTVEVPTWHLHCSEVLGPRYAEEIRRFTGEALEGKQVQALKG